MVVDGLTFMDIILARQQENVAYEDEKIDFQPVYVIIWELFIIV